VPNLAGAVTAAVLVKAGIFDEVKPKARPAMLGPGAELITKGEVEMGFFNLSEVLPGLKVVGPPPAPLQGYTFYEAAVPAKAVAPSRQWHSSGASPAQARATSGGRRIWSRSPLISHRNPLSFAGIQDRRR
jgi:hypothetical protein